MTEAASVEKLAASPSAESENVVDLRPGWAATRPRRLRADDRARFQRYLAEILGSGWISTRPEPARRRSAS